MTLKSPAFIVVVCALLTACTLSIKPVHSSRWFTCEFRPHQPTKSFICRSPVYAKCTKILNTPGNKSMSDSYPVKKYREARLTLMHIFIYVKPLSRKEQEAINRVEHVLNRLIPEEK